MKTIKKQRMAPALDRGLKVLELLAGEDSELSLKSIGERLGIPQPSLWRIVRVLRENGYLLFDPEKRTYRLGFKFLYLGNVLLRGMGFRSQARRFLKRLVELSGETAELSARIKDQLVLIDQVEGPEAVRLFSSVGSAYPYFHATAPGKVYLAHMSEKKLRDVMNRMGMPRITQYTIGSWEDLEKEMRLVRERGYAFDDQEMRMGVFRIAAPVYDHKEKVVACLGVAGPSFRINPEKVKKVGRWSIQLASGLSREVREQNSAVW